MQDAQEHHIAIKLGYRYIISLALAVFVVVMYDVVKMAIRRYKRENRKRKSAAEDEQLFEDSKEQAELAEWNFELETMRRWISGGSRWRSVGRAEDEERRRRLEMLRQ